MASTLAAGTARTPRLPLAGRIFGLFTPHLNRYVARIAGGRFVPMWSLLRHRGRRSGRAYATPVTTFRVRDGFAIALAFGPRADWARNVLDSEASIRWRGREYPLSRGEVLDASSSSVALPALQWALFRRLGIKQLVYLKDREVPAR